MDNVSKIFNQILGVTLFKMTLSQSGSALCTKYRVVTKSNPTENLFDNFNQAKDFFDTEVLKQRSTS
jgi:hypothetical protein